MKTCNKADKKRVLDPQYQFETFYSNNNFHINNVGIFQLNLAKEKNYNFSEVPPTFVYLKGVAGG